jgi:AcrR family transcriptional regulator
MDLKIKMMMNEHLFVRDPESTLLGKKIIRESIVMINDIGFEDFTFKKLATIINTTESSIYRYFENKQRLLVYIITLYWNLLEYQVVFHLNNIVDPKIKIAKIIELLSCEINADSFSSDYDTGCLYQIVIAESNKVYLNKKVTDNNEVKLFKPYKDLCARIASIILEYNSSFKFAHSLSSTLVETAHLQKYFMQHLPSLTNKVKGKDDTIQLKAFLEHLVFSSINKINLKK